MLSKKKVEEIANQNILIGDLSDDELAEFCIIANQMYRDGESIVSDQDYDFVFLAALTKRLPNHPFLQKLESEQAVDGKDSEGDTDSSAIGARDAKSASVKFPDINLKRRHAGKVDRLEQKMTNEL